MRHLLLPVLLSLMSHASMAAQAPHHCLSMHGSCKYPKDFKAFDYVNPNAPKGGILRLAEIGSFDSLNPFIVKGNPPAGLSLLSEVLVYEPLMRRARDEPFSLYAGLAESYEMAEDRSSITFHINPNAKWADGKPVTADDVIFTHQLLATQGRPNLQTYYKQAEKVEKLDDLSVRYTFKMRDDGTYDQELPLLHALMYVLPKHVLEGRDFEKMSMEPIIGSGPYKVGEVKPGHSISYERREDYWGKDLPTTTGLYNFQTVRYDYYRDDKVALEAFKAGEVDMRGERNPSLWKNGYDCPALKKGEIIREEVDLKSPHGMFGLVFNTRRPLFADQRVREALNMVFDFDSFNRIVLHNDGKRSVSFFTGTELAASGKPTGDELALLTPFKDKLPAEVFEEATSEAKVLISQDLRANIKKAQELLSQAGWELKSNTLIHKDTKQEFSFELLLYRPEDEKVALHFARNLKPLGIRVNTRVLETAQYMARTSAFDFDMMIWTWGGTRSPGQEQRYYWGSKAADEQGSRNYPGIKNPVVDALTEKMTSAKDRKGLEAAARALDRVLRTGKYVVPLYHINKNRLAYRRDFRHPEMKEYVPVLLSTWWYQPTPRR